MNQHGDDSTAASPDGAGSKRTAPLTDPAPAEVSESSTPQSGEATTRLTRLGHYSLVRIIAEGGMGTVYEAIQDKPRRTVAVKRMHHGLTSPTALRRFDFESQLLARLRHPGIAQVYEAGTDREGNRDVPFFAMEYIPGAKPITEYAMEKKLSVRERLELFIQVCDALEHAHEKGVLHRDLKPQNILVDVNGRPKVIDFGIARAVDADQAPASLQTSPDQLLGTLQYMSPEQLDGDPRELDARADVYALGVVLYELLCGQLPYDLTRSRLTEASRMLRERQPLRPGTINRDLKGDLETVVLTALHKDRERRYQSARELAHDLRRVLAEETLSARRDSALYIIRTKLRANVKRHRVGSLVITAILALLISEFGGEWLDDQLDITYRLEKFALRHLSVFPFDSLPNVAMVVIRDLKRVAAHEGIDISNRSDLKWQRLVHGKVLSRLASTKAAAVMLDYFIEEPSTPEQDDALLRGVDDVTRNGIGVVMAVSNWRLKDGKPRIFPALLERVTWGVATDRRVEGEPSSAYLAARHANSTDCIPGFSVAGFAASKAPGVQPTVDIDRSRKQLRVHYQASGAAVRPTDTLFPTHIWELAKDRPNVGLNESDDTAESYVAIPSDAVLQKSTFDVEQVLDATDADLHRWFKGKVVLLFSYVAPNDQLTYFDGRHLLGSHVQAVATDALINGRLIHRPAMIKVFRWDLTMRVPVEVAIVIAGTLAGAIVARRSTWKLAWTARLLIVVLVVGACILSYREHQLLYSPWVPLLGAFMSFELAHAFRRSALRRII